ncbi:MAG: S-layer homology domain-containing protein [Clostridia bacterium]|nr:S-layer homology domain-containing protein [Clostridia bacterium]
MSKRLISMLTVVTMLMTMLSGAALAVSEDTGITNEARLNAAIEAAEEGGTVTLEGNIELTERLTISKEITIDLGGHTISADFEGDYGAIYVGMAGDLTLTNGTVTSAKTYAVGNYGTLTLDGVTLQCEDEELASLYNFYYNNETYGKTTVTEGVLGTVWNCGELEIVRGTFDYIDNSGYMAVADATINGIYGADGTDAPGVEKCGTIELAGGEVVLGGDAEIATPIVVTETVTLDMDGFKIYNETGIWNTTGDNKDWSLISVQGGKLTITGEGTLAPLEDDCYSVDVRNGGEVTIENGTIGGNISAVYVHDGVANINGGTYSITQLSEHEDERFTLNCLDENYPETAKIIVKGGSFNKFNPAENLAEGAETNFVAEGFEATAEGDVYTVSEIVVTPPEIDPPVEDDPPAEDDDDDYTPVVTPSVTVKDEKGNAVEFEKQADGTLVVETEEDTEFTVDTRDGKDAVVKYETEGTNYGLVAVIVNEDGTETVITDTIPTENGIEFAVKDGQTVKIVDKTEVFDDVNAGDWNHDAVTFAAARGIVNGVGDNKFEPSAAATRGMVMTMLARLEGVDTDGGETWFSEGMDWAKENGISDGTSPEAVISREQLIVMLWRLEGEPKANGNVNGFNDGADISAWAVEAMEWAVEIGIMQGNDNQLMPQGSANRDQVAQILMNFILMK